jgi:hypothetical protein
MRKNVTDELNISSKGPQYVSTVHQLDYFITKFSNVTINQDPNQFVLI